MDSSLAPVSDQTDETLIKDFIYMDTYTFISAIMLFAAFLIIVTQFRLWHRNKFLKMIPHMATYPVYSLINQSIGFAAAYQNEEQLYLIWVVILLIAHDNVFNISRYSLLEKGSDRWSREFSFLYNCIFTAVLIIRYKGSSEFYHPLLALLALVLAKFLIQIMSYVFSERAYGTENINLVAEYMKSEHKLTQPSDAIDPTSMKGYKYLVMGEEKIKSQIKAPDYSPEVTLTDAVVTVERVWSCKKGLLHHSIDTDGNIKDICLSFALFKLLRRRDFVYLAAEAKQPKTRQLIFNGLLAGEDKERVFRVIKMELGFLRDLIFTKYPVVFAFGLPVWNSILLGGMIGVTLWLAIKSFRLRNTFIFLTVKSHNVDYPLTISLLILLILMELVEWLTYVFCDWTRVVIICQNVKRNSSLDTNEEGPSDATNEEGPSDATNEEGPSDATNGEGPSDATNEEGPSDATLHQAQPCLFGYKVLAHFCKPRFSLSAMNTLGQYSLLKNCHKTRIPWYYLMTTCAPCHKMDVRPPGVKRGEVVPITTEVKKAIIGILLKSRGTLTKGRAALLRNRASIYEDIRWTLDLPTLVHTIMVWHVATSLCAIPLVNVEESIKSDHEVATYLSNYCAYLVAFYPDLLPDTSNLVKYMFWEIVKETSEFFGKERNLEEKCEMLKRLPSSSGDGAQTIIHRGSKLGLYLAENITDESQRWKLMADFWSEILLYVAPRGDTRVHIEELSNGSEFITHLWALLYHAGIIDNDSDEYHP